MPLADAKEILQTAREGGYAVAAFNVNDLEFVQAVVTAAEEEDAPTFVAMSEAALAYGGDALAWLALDIIDGAQVPLVLHLDHGSGLDAARKAVELGFNSVMVDGSTLPYDENVALAAAAVEEFAPGGVAVEAELGHVAKGHDRGAFTEPDEAAAFVKATGVHSLAVAIGTSHGAYKFEGEPTIEVDRLEAIAEATPVPLVLHGASAVYEDAVKTVEAGGGRLRRARGLSDKLLRQAVARGIAKVNVDTDLRLAFVGAVRKYFKNNPSAIDPKKILGAGRDAVREMARRKIRACRGDAR
jgi:fructose-bisphosphate aldolase class II